VTKAARAARAPARRPAARKASAGRSGARRCWLVKSDPESYAIADLERDGTTGWDGVRNYQARNTLRDEMAMGDRVLFYHSGVEPMAIVGRCEVASRPRPDETAFRRGHEHFDPDSDPAEPTWWLVDLRHVETFAVPLVRERLAREPALRGMVLLQRGSRLSVQPVSPAEYDAVLALARRAARERAT